MDKMHEPDMSQRKYPNGHKHMTSYVMKKLSNTVGNRLKIKKSYCTNTLLITTCII